tara:strand:- start:1016 stop:2146 length:1131 start_codon:yes stop_codon:yes gene_type:complete
MIEFSGCGQENKYILEKEDKDFKIFFSLVTNNTQVRSRRSEDLEQILIEFGKLPEVKCKVVGSATDGLFFSLISSGLKVGSKIGVTAYSFHASASSIVRAGHIPVFIDVDFNGLTNLEDFEKIAKELDCIVIVNLFGHKINEKKFLNICTKFNVKFIEDAAQRHIFSKTLLNSDLCISSVLSFDPFKIFSGIGTGGAVVTKDVKVAKNIKNLYYHGQRCEIQGYNSQMSECSAWLIKKKIENFENWQKKRIIIAKNYTSILSNFNQKLRTLVSDNVVNEHSLHKYVVVFNKEKDRDYIQKKLANENIKTMIHYTYILPELGLFKKFRDISNLINKSNYNMSRNLSQHSLSLPIHPFIKEDEISKLKDRLTLHLKNL